MTTQTEALKLALEALKTLHDENMDYLTRNKLGGENNQCMVFAREAITAIKEALAQPEQEPVAWEQFYPDIGKPQIKQPKVRTGDCLLVGVCASEGHKIQKVQSEQEPEFIQHVVEHPTDWSEWVCPNPKGYLMKCCDCGLVHEAEFGVVRYKSETEREYCDMVGDPNLQAVFRMRRSEQWSPEDTAHRAGGLPMAQPKQEQDEPVAVVNGVYGGRFIVEPTNSSMVLPVNMALYAHPPQRTWVGLTDDEIDKYFNEEWSGYSSYHDCFKEVMRWQETKLKEKNGF